jgi:hypothetical protein
MFGDISMKTKTILFVASLLAGAMVSLANHAKVGVTEQLPGSARVLNEFFHFATAEEDVPRSERRLCEVSVPGLDMVRAGDAPRFCEFCQKPS